MITTVSVRGKLVGGSVELLEPLDAPDGVEVEVSLALAPPAVATSALPMRATFGMFRKDGASFTTAEDWEKIKKIWEPRAL